MNRLVVAAGLVLGLGLGLAGCGGGGSGTPSATTSSTSSSTASGRPSDPAASSSGSTASRPADPLAGASLPPVVRDGRTPRDRLSAAPVKISRPLRYSDGMRLRITSVRQGQVTGQGPGVVRGPRTTFALRLTNGSGATLDLDQVVVTLVYGTPARIAQPVYDAGARDFGGRVRPGASASAAYAFSIPASGRGRVAVHVDFDATHAAAVFTGAVS